MIDGIIAVLCGEEIDIEQYFNILPEGVREHSLRVCEQTADLLELAREQGIFEADGVELSEEFPWRGALYHDIGQTLIPKEILNKPQEWNGAERRVYEQHTIFGAKLIERYRRQKRFKGKEEAFWKMAAEIALSHHERWDGKGYPYGSNTTAVPVAARAVSIADTYDSYLYGTPNRMPLPQEFALLELLEGSGKRFDPRLVQIFQEHHPVIS